MTHTNPIRQPIVFIAAALILACGIAVAAALVMSVTFSGVTSSTSLSESTAGTFSPANR